jgi:hypothetical protein
MARVLIVHGIANTYGGPAQMLQGWIPALVDGVALAGGHLDPSDVGSVFYGDVFRPAGKFLAAGDAVSDLDWRDVTDEDLELLMAWWEAAAASDPLVAPPDGQSLGPRDVARAALLALSGSQFLAGLSEPVVVWWLKQVGAYFRDPEVRAAAQARLAEQVGDDARVVVAHSLGSVVVYEGLCAHPGWPITDLVTLGSPLGVRQVVFDRLRPAPASSVVASEMGMPGGRWPGRVQRWVNISDGADFVALQPRLRSLFGDRVVDVRIDNGVRAHSVQRYLSAAETGAAVLAGLKG